MGSKLGALKVAAGRVGLTFDEYLDHLTANRKRCILCKEWKSRYDFNVDTTRGDGLCAKCKECQQRLSKERYVPVPDDERKPMGPPRLPRRDGDKVQARARINADIRMGFRKDSNELHCAYCGHKGNDRRHEYHHHLGYDAEHHYDVLPACSKCHHAQEEPVERTRGDNGQFVAQEMEVSLG